MILYWLLYNLLLNVNCLNINYNYSHNNHSKIHYPKICDSEVYQISGYIDVAKDKELFFWFFESKSNPAEDPLILWLNGGPGCSSMFGLIVEIGPCTLDPLTNQTVNNPYAWNTKANLLFIDQPTNTGFSKGKYIDSTQESAQDLYQFLLQFFTKFSKYKDLKFHIFGESFAGKYIPTLASLILEKNDLIDQGLELKEDWFSMNLKSIGMGNPFIEPMFQSLSSVEFACENPYNPVTESECKKMQCAIPPAKEKLERCLQHTGGKGCVDEIYDVEDIIYDPYDSRNISIYDLTKTVEEMDILDDEIYFNLPQVQKELGAPLHFQFHSCNDEIGDIFYESGSYIESSRPEVIKVLNAPLPTLVYVGDRDYICHWMGLKNLFMDFNWMHQLEFNAVEDKPWISYDNRTSGEFRQFENLTFLKFFEAGHFVPYFHRQASLLMVNRWLDQTSIEA